MTRSLNARSTRWLDVVGCIVIAALCIIAYSSLTSAQFVPFDDDIEITLNPHIRGLTAENLVWMFTNTSHTQRYTPLSWLVWGALYQLFGLNPEAFHMEALLVHIANAVLLFVLIRKLLTRITPAAAAHNLSLASLAGAAIWALHPLRVEVVAWATQVRFAEASLFVLIATLLYLKAVDQSALRPYATRAYWLSVISFAASVLFYPSGIGLIAVLLLLDFFPLRRANAATAGFKDLVRFSLEKLPFLLPAIIAGVMTIYGRLTAAQGSATWQAPVTLDQFGIGQRVMQAAYIFIYYLWKPFDPLHISPVYTQLVNFDAWSPAFLNSLLAVVVITAAAIYFRRRFPVLAIVWFAHLALIFPVGGYFEHPHYPSDRYAYLQGMLLSVLIAAGILWVLTRSPRTIKMAVLGFIATLMLIATMLSYLQSVVWHDGETLFRHIIAELGEDPYRYDPLWRLGNYYASQNRIRDAMEAYDQSIEVNPQAPGAWQFKAILLEKIADSGRANHAPAEQLRAIYLDAARTYDGLARLVPTTQNVAAAGMAYAEAGDISAALTRMEAVIAVAPENADYRLRYARVLAASGRRDQAVAQLDAAIRLDPRVAADRQTIIASWPMGPATVPSSRPAGS